MKPLKSIRDFDDNHLQDEECPMYFKQPRQLLDILKSWKSRIYF